MKIKTSELSGDALDWAVAKCEGELDDFNERLTCADSPCFYSTDWSQGGPIIERERLLLHPGPVWYAMSGLVNQPMTTRQSGPTPLVAAMRCFVASKLGDEVEVPDELHH